MCCANCLTSPVDLGTPNDYSPAQSLGVSSIQAFEVLFIYSSSFEDKSSKPCETITIPNCSTNVSFGVRMISLCPPFRGVLMIAVRGLGIWIGHDICMHPFGACMCPWWLDPLRIDLSLFHLTISRNCLKDAHHKPTFYVFTSLVPF